MLTLLAEPVKKGRKEAQHRTILDTVNLLSIHVNAACVRSPGNPSAQGGCKGPAFLPSSVPTPWEDDHPLAAPGTPCPAAESVKGP